MRNEPDLFVSDFRKYLQKQEDEIAVRAYFSKKYQPLIDDFKLSEARCRLLTRVAELMMAILEAENHKELNFADKLSLNQLPDMVNSATCLQQLADLEKIIESFNNYLKSLV